MDFIDAWMLMEDGCIVGHLHDKLEVSTFRTDHVIDITPLSNGNSLLETTNYYCELGDPKGKCKRCGSVGAVNDESLLCSKCDVDVEMGF